MPKQVIYVTGLPRSGSTLLCQLLGMHSDIHSIVHSSPLANIVENIRQNISNNSFFLSQLDSDFDLVYARLRRALASFTQEWLNESPKPFVVDKNRSWLSMLQTVYDLDPSYKMLVCVRDLVQLYGSIDKQHKDTILISYGDPSTTNSSWYRADSSFSTTGVVGAPLRAIENLQDISPGCNTSNNLYFVRFETLLADTENELNRIAKFIGVESFSNFDKDNLLVKPSESDSHYRFKFKHTTFPVINKPTVHKIPYRVEFEIVKKFQWYFDYFYPNMYGHHKAMTSSSTFGSNTYPNQEFT